jgi:glutamine amidotransferase
VKIDIIDYGVGNLASVSKALAFSGAAPRRISDPASISETQAIVIPGVGHFAATAALGLEWRRFVLEAIARGVPVLGICLGMQWLFDGSAEDARVGGLGVLSGTCSALSGDVKVPHVGWNSLDRLSQTSRLLAGIAEGASTYFTHSFAAPVTGATAATTTHGREFASVVERDRVFGVQWHPEKSGAVGLQLLANFVRIAEAAAC